MDRSWMYDRFNPHRKGLNYEFVSGVQEFIKKAKEQPCFLSERKIKCPCATCKCVKSLTPREVKTHLYKSGFQLNYSVWTEHGEFEQNICLGSRSNSSRHMEEEDPKTPHMDEQEEEEDPKVPHMEESEEEEDPKTPHTEESEEEEDPNALQVSDKQNADGKVLIRPCGLGWAPSAAPAAAIKHAIQSHFQGPFYRWSETPKDVREYWWKLFGDKIAWDPRDHGYIKKTFQTRGAKRLSDMLSKVRKKGTRPHWICEEAWMGLNAHWEGESFMKISTQNKTNRASGKGGAVHTTGRKAHVDVALSMAQELGRSVDPDELFLATHKRKSGNWVDDRSQTTYKHYHDRLKEVQTQNGEASQNGTQEVDGATKLELWKEVAGGKSRGRCYGTADFALNLRRGVTSLTQESREPYSGGCDHAMHLEAIDAVRKEAAAAHQEAAAARQEAATARQEAAESKQHYQLLEEQLRKVMKHMKALERQSAGAFTSVSQARRGRQSAGAFTSASQARRGHPRYDDDYSLDEFLADRRRKKHLAPRRHPHYDDDYSLDEIFPNRRQKRQAHKRHHHYDDEDSLDELLPKQHQAERGHPRYDDEDSLDEVLPKQRQAKRGRSHYDDGDSLDEVLPKQHHAKRGHPHYDDDDDLLDGVLPKQRQAKKRHPHYDNDEHSLHEDLPKNHQAKRGHPYYDDEDNLLDGVLQKQPQAKKQHPHYDNDEDSLHEDLPKNHQAERGQPHYDDDDDLPDGVLLKQHQAKKLHPHYDNDEDSLHEDLPKNHKAKRGRPLYDDTDSLDEVLPARRRRRYHS